MAARSLSALPIASIEVRPLMPGVSRALLSVWLCWLPSGSRDQNTAKNGLPLAFSSGSTALVKTAAK